jgi:predicted PurR-regulated permease PerM
MDRNWSPTTKRWVVIFSVVAIFLVVRRIGSILPPIIITFILAYILIPIADFLSTHLRLKRALAVLIIYLVLIAILVTLPALFIPPLIAQIENFIEGLPELIQDIGEFSERPLIFRDYTLDVPDIYQQVSDSLEGILTSLATQTISILTDVASAVIWLVFILVASFYLVKDAAVVKRWVDEVIPPQYRDDVRQLQFRIASSWNAFLRGQLILMVVMGVIVGMTMALIGLPNAWLIGLLFGLLEFIPNLGPTIASVPAVLIAYFQGSTVLNISNGWFTILVIGVNFVLQQLENNYLVPRIMGQSLNLHPVVVLTAAIVGAHVAGVLGILLAAPTVATLRILAEYTYRRLLDLPPFPAQQAKIQPEVSEREIIEEDKEARRVSPSVVTTEGKQAEQ